MLNLDVSKLYDQYCDTLVPDDDKSSTVEGELVRALMKIEYRFFNDGDKFYSGYGCDTAGQAATFLHNKCSKMDDLEGIASIISKMARCDIEYKSGIEEIKSELINYINSKNGNLTANTEDMYDAISLWTNDEDEDLEYDDDDLNLIDSHR